MKPSEAMRIAWEAILKNKVRSFLTMLGIIIGVAAVIIMVAISAGTEATIQEQITSLGSNLIFVQGGLHPRRTGPGAARADWSTTTRPPSRTSVSGVTAVVVEQNSIGNGQGGGCHAGGYRVTGHHHRFPLRARHGAWPRDATSTIQRSNARAKVAVLGSNLAAGTVRRRQPHRADTSPSGTPS